MSTDSPSWFTQLEPLSFVEKAQLSDLHTQLNHDGRFNIVEGQSNRGLHAAAYWLQHFPTQLCVAQLQDCHDPEDILLCISSALGQEIRGNVMSLCKQLQNKAIQLVILDAATSKSLAVIDQLQTILPEIRWLMISEQPLAPQVLAFWSVASTPVEPIDRSYRFSVSQQCLAFLSAGLQLNSSLPQWARHPSSPDRTMMNQRCAKLIRKKAEQLPSQQMLEQYLQPILQIALGHSIPTHVDITTLFALRWLARNALDPVIAFQASIAMARLYLVWGQIDKALSALVTAQNRNPTPPPQLIAMLHHTGALAHLQCGDWSQATLRYQQAIRHIERSKDQNCLIILLRQQAEMHLLWGHFKEAETLFRGALRIVQQLDNEAEYQAILRGLAELAMVNSESIGGLSLLDQAQSFSSHKAEESNCFVTLSGLFLLRGDTEKSNSMLEQSKRIVNPPPLLRANHLRRAAEISFALQRYQEGIRFAEFAQRYYVRAGERISVGSTTRLLGDIHRAAGNPQAAFVYYRKALELQSEIGDIHGLQRSLIHCQQLLQSEHPEIANLLQEFRIKLSPSTSTAELSASVPRTEITIE